MSESGHAQRRAGLPVELFDEIMAEALQPLVEQAHHPQAFYQGWRLVGVDATKWSATRTPAIRAVLPKAASRRLSSALSKVRLISFVPVTLILENGSVWVTLTSEEIQKVSC